MTYADLEKVLASYEEHSFTAAARRLYMSQPAVSQNILRLEKELNVQLFVRDNGTIIPTPACEAFVSYAARIRELWKELEKEMESHRPSSL